MRPVFSTTVPQNGQKRIGCSSTASPPLTRGVLATVSFRTLSSTNKFRPTGNERARSMSAQHALKLAGISGINCCLSIVRVLVVGDHDRSLRRRARAEPNALAAHPAHGCYLSNSRGNTCQQDGAHGLGLANLGAHIGRPGLRLLHWGADMEGMCECMRSRIARVLTTLMRNGRGCRSEYPGKLQKERVSHWDHQRIHMRASGEAAASGRIHARTGALR